MMKFKSPFGTLYPRICQNLHRFCTKPAEKLNLESETKATDAVLSYNSASVTESAEPLKSTGSSKVPDKQIAKNLDVRAKQGKKCGQSKAMIPKDPGPPGGGNFEDKCDFYIVHKSNSKKWKKISFVLLPLIAAFSTIVLTGSNEHPKEEYIPYEYLNIRNKRFPWGEGKRSLFHGPNNHVPEE